ncbi:alkaline phosphatase D family protein [Robertkochia solimangrovi]|uniref:alkaline phosphatase D family protein n=1 Tax=Robertkochia solimangrovi TaxID=2213046 RepID=UPI00117E1785|nr:alkaline phosphatase D family protein [Robertkochia solimangrovi]TRZ43596.1 alkaline phosphatase family protein [Robertkochia solimangrovi]
MRTIYYTILPLLLLMGCGSSKSSEARYPLRDGDFVIAFGSCNRQTEENYLWDDVLAFDPNIWIWGGDNIYADTDDVREMRKDYEEQRWQHGYRDLTKQVEVIGTWDDHDYGANDAGEEYPMKKESQELFLNFMEVPKNHPRRFREGVYESYVYPTAEGTVKVIVLDTRYFRSPLTRNLGESGRKYIPNNNSEGTILGAQQWLWFTEQLKDSEADFNIIVSSIQVLSNKHGFETWGNFPNEVKRLFDLIAESQAKGVILLSGDRHISEFSQINIPGVNYPLIDFTSSGLTHTYTEFEEEENPYRIGRVVKNKSFGLLKLNFRSKTATMEMIGNNKQVYQEYKQAY